MTGIYRIYNRINGNCYVGSAININKRFNEHRNALRKNCHYNGHLQKAWNKYGENSFLFSVIYQCEKDFLIDYEQRAIDFHKGRGILYNLSPTAGNCLGVKPTEETKRKISEAQKGKIIPEEQRKRTSLTLMGRYKGINNPCYGKKRSPETLKKMSDALKGHVAWNKGMKMSDEHRKKLSEVHKGHYPSDESRRKRSVTIRKLIAERGPLAIGWHQTDEAKRKISIGAKGRIKSPEECKLISEIHKGMKHTEETKQKIRETKRLYYLERKKVS